MVEGYVTPVYSGVRKTGNTIKGGYITPALLGAKKWAELRCNPLAFTGPQKRRPNQKWLYHPCLPKGPQLGGYVTPVFSWFPRKGYKNKRGYITPTFFGPHKWAGLLRNPYVPGGSLKRGQNQKWLHHPYLLKDPINGRSCYVTPMFVGVPGKGDKIKSGCIISAFSGAHKWAQLLHDPCVLGAP